MLDKIRCVDASVKHFSKISNQILHKSPKFAEEAYFTGAITSRKPFFNDKSTREFYGLDGFYKQNGEIYPEAKAVLEKKLESFGLRKNATMEEFKRYLIGLYK